MPLWDNIKPYSDEQLNVLINHGFLIDATDYVQAYFKALATCKRLMKERDNCGDDMQDAKWEREHLD